MPVSSSMATSTGKLDLANVMKLCGITDDEDFMDTDDMQSSAPTYDSNAAPNDIMVTIPYSHNSDTPFSFTIPSSETVNTVQTQRNPATIPSTMNDGRIMSGERQYTINIEHNDGTPPFPYSITLPQNLDPMIDMNGAKIHAVVSAATTNSPVSAPTNVMANASYMTPTLQSQINEIQNQLIGVVSHSSTNFTPTVTTTTKTSTVATNSSNSSTTTQKATKKKPATKRNGKKILETLNVPSQIGNIQISQVDRSKSMQSNVSKAPPAIENQIQITPIVTTSNANQSHALSSQSATPNSAITVNMPQPQIIGIPNHVQIITSSTNVSNTNSMITNTIASHNANSNNGIIINTQSGPSPIVQSTINSTGNIITNVSNAQQQPRPFQTIIQSAPNVNVPMQMLSNDSHLPTLPQLTGSLTLSFSEDGRFLLRHNPNAPQDAQSQHILQALLSGALCNVTLINEPSTLPTSTNNSIIDNNKTSIIIKNDQIISNQAPVITQPAQITNSVPTKTVNDKNVMVSYSIIFSLLCFNNIMFR